MSRAGLVRRVALAAMLVVTASACWAWAQHDKPAVEKPVAGERHGASAATHEESEEPTVISVNWTEFGKETPPFVAMVLNFGLLAGAYYALGRKPIAAGLQARRDHIAKEIDEARKMQQEAEARAKTYQAKLEKLEEEVSTARDALVRAGEAERDRIVKEAEAKADRARRDAEFMVEQELKQIRQDLWRETVETAVSAAEELLKKRVTQADQERLAEDYLADLGGKARAPMRPTESA